MIFKLNSKNNNEKKLKYQTYCKTQNKSLYINHLLSHSKIYPLQNAGST